MKTFEHLEGKDVKVMDGSGYIYTGLVVGCDYDIGITIVDKDDKNVFLVCLNGSLSPVQEYRFPEKLYDKLFYLLVGSVGLSRLSFKEIESVICVEGQKGRFIKLSEKTCAFNQ